jgi:Mg2+ and Co2+ transporter CorA
MLTTQFHYDDVSKHTRRVLERCLASHDDEATSDWISHGLLDSIIDAFFPLMGYVDGAVDDMDSLTIDPRTDPRTTAPSHATLSSGLDTMDPPYDQDAEDEKASAGASDDKDEWIELEKLGRAGKSTAVKKKGGHVGITGLQLRQRGGKASRALRKRKASFSRNIRGDNTFSPYPLSRGHILWDWSTKWMVIFLYLKLFFLPVTDARERLGHSVGGDKVVFDRSTMLKSITNMRRLVSGLSRLLGGKNAVVTSLLKRAHDSNAGGDDEAYLSDVHDHILLLQTSLYHYEYILSHCQPAYLSYLNVSSASARGGTDMLILALSTVSIGILPMQLVTGLFSMNVYRPSNGDQDEHLGADGKPAGFGWFAGIVVMVFVIACGLATIVRWWRWVARKKWTRRRGGKLPSEWAGFWGWD